jgi:acyl-CoA synthetase (AMP-forming)/AMP-acid ligase II
MSQRGKQGTPLFRDIVRSCRRRRWAVKIIDSTGMKLTGGRLLAGALLWRRVLRRHSLRSGERLVVVHVPLPRTPDDLCHGLAEAGPPNLFVPSRDSFVEVDRLPVNGAGKLDLKRIKQIAMEGLVGGAAVTP